MNCIGCIRECLPARAAQCSTITLRITVLSVLLLFILGAVFMGLALKGTAHPATGVSLMLSSIGLFSCLSSCVSPSRAPLPTSDSEESFHTPPETPTPPVLN